MQGTNKLRHSLPNCKFSMLHSTSQVPALVQRDPSPSTNRSGGDQDLAVAQETDRPRYPLRKGAFSSMSSFRARSYSKCNSPLRNPLPILKEVSDKPPLPTQTLARNEAKTVPYEDAVDAFLSINEPVSTALELFFTKYLAASVVCYWEDVPSLQVLFSRTKGLKCQRDAGIAGAAFVAREKTKSPTAAVHPAFNEVDGQLANGDCPVICFPLWDNTNAICGVVEAFREPGAEEFGSSDEEFIDYFTKKFKILSKFLLASPPVDSLIYDVMQLMPLDQFLSMFEKRVSDEFNCRRCEVWRYEKAENRIVCLTNERTVVDAGHTGIVGDAIRSSTMLNCARNKLHGAYDAVADGNDEEPVLVLPVVDSRSEDQYAVALRGPRDRPMFTLSDEKRLKHLGPLLALAMANALYHSSCFVRYQKTKFEQQGLDVLLDIAEAISSSSDVDKVTTSIVEKAKVLTNADRCSLFLVNDKGDRLVSTANSGLKNAIDIPIKNGIVGKSVAENRTFIVGNAYSDPSFDRSIDEKTGYRTKTLLSVPIREGNKVIGVTEMVNKNGGKPFSEWDAKLIEIFNVFCGIVLEKARLYKESSQMSTQIHSFFEVSLSLSKAESLRTLLAEIMQNARNVVGADRASLFLLDPAAQCLKSLIFDGGDAPPTLPLGTGIAAFSAMKKESLIVNDVYHDPRFNKAVDQQTGFKTKSVCVTPVVGADGSVLGVVQMVNKTTGDFTDSDLHMLVCFAGFASVAMENNKLKDIATLGNVEVELEKWVGKSEIEKCDEVPTLLRLNEDQLVKIRQLNFFAIDWNDIDKIKILFSLFDEFHLMSEFKISNVMLFRFLYEIRSTYHTVPYHNWIHAVDVAQYVSYELRTSNLVTELTRFELLAMLVSAICHDAGHDGFNNIYNVKAETPLGILFKDQSVMETHHCSVAISILSRDECNLFHTLSDDQIKKMWTTIITLILATDMAHHFKLVKTASEVLDTNSFNIHNIEHRILLMQLILKVGDISNVSRPFTIADKWCDVLSQEFFRQGDHELKQGIGLTSPLNDREHPDKPKSQIGFYNFICIPLYQAVSRMCPELVVNLNSVKANLEVWKSMMPPPEPKPEVEKK